MRARGADSKSNEEWESYHKITFEYEYVENILDLVKQIKECEGKHTQQAVFSTFHGALTQICYQCKKVRSNIRR